MKIPYCCAGDGDVKAVSWTIGGGPEIKNDTYDLLWMKMTKIQSKWGIVTRSTNETCSNYLIEEGKQFTTSLDIVSFANFALLRTFFFFSLFIVAVADAAFSNHFNCEGSGKILSSLLFFYSYLLQGSRKLFDVEKSEKSNRLKEDFVQR